MSLLSAQDLKQDVLFRGSEPINGSSAWDEKVIDYLNRVYATLAAGASEFLPEYIEDWWWLRDEGSMLLDPVWNTGTISLTNGNDEAVLTDPPSAMLPGEWRLRVQQHRNVYVVDAFSTPNITLDQPWVGDTGSYQFDLMHTKYTLAEGNIASLIGPMVGYEGIEQINGLTPERMDFLYPLSRLVPGPPLAFSLENEAKPTVDGSGTVVVRFSHGGRTDGVKSRVEYRFKPRITPLTDSGDSYPLVPEQWRQILSDMALSILLLDKNDDRSNAIALLARTGLSGMLKENRRRLAKMDEDVGKIFTRQNNGRVPGRPMTESGLRLR